MRLPYLLTRDMTLIKSIRPTGLSMVFSLRDMDTAEMTLPESEIPEPEIHEFVELETPSGAPALYRVAAFERVYGSEIKLTLNHAIDVLNDRVYSAATNPSRTALASYISALLATSPGLIWTLGTTTGISSYKWYRDSTKNECSLDLLNEVKDALVDHMFTYDYPDVNGHIGACVLNVAPLPTDVGAEFRLSRNIKECTVNVDDTDMCNRIYMMFTRKGASTQSNYTYNDTASQAEYGLIEQGIEVSEEETGGATVALRQAWADKYFKQHAKPNAAITISGYQLKRLTGLDWDEASVGKLVRVALPGYHDYFEERCLEVSYDDALNKPEEVTVQLGVEMPTVSEELAFMAKRTGSSSRRYLYNAGGTIVEEEETT